jgi:DNA repair photolyase
MNAPAPTSSSLPDYSYGLSLTSQFYFCGLPLRLDPYSRCLFNCCYCFASARGGNRGSRRLSVFTAQLLRNRFERSMSGKTKNVLEEMLSERQPVHIGGMSDPLPPLESELGVTLEILDVLADYQYPTIISTKSTLVSTDPFLEVLRRGPFAVQMSISTLNQSIAKNIDLGAPTPQARLETLRQLTQAGIPTACRIQPLLPGREGDAFEIIDAAAQMGVKHIGIEHLKLPIETTWWGTERLTRSLGFNMAEYFTAQGAQRIGREWILPVDQRLARMLELSSHVRTQGATFGAADNDLLLLSDGECCCSGADLLLTGTNFFRYNYLEAVRRGTIQNRVSIDSLNDVWRPQASVAPYINSRSRLPSKDGRGVGLQEYLLHNWNGRSNGNSPASFYGVVATTDRDSRGYKIYRFEDDAHELLLRHGARR